MLEAFIIGFWKVLAWPAFGYMLIGIAIGFWVGLLPGIGGLSTLALMLPFSYSIKDPTAAFAFLLGMLAVTGTTGDLTSILFGIPGEGSSAALILGGDRSRSADWIVALHVREPLSMGPARPRPRRRGNVRHSRDCGSGGSRNKYRQWQARKAHRRHGRRQGYIPSLVAGVSLQHDRRLLRRSPGA